MTELDQDLLRTLADWSSNGTPVSTLYLDVDGRRYPRKQDFLVRAEELCRRLKAEAHELARPARLSVEKDAGRILRFFGDLDRGPTRGVAIFSSSGAGLWEDVRVPRPVKDRAAVAPHPYVIPLEALVETYESFFTCLVDREKARIFLARMGRIREETDLFDDVPGQHEQGGWSQSRYRRHIEEHMVQHLKHVSDVLLRYFKQRGFDHLILGGPQEVLAEFERHLHDYLKRRVVARTQLAMTSSAADVQARSLQVEEEIEERKERETVERLLAAASAGRSAVTGLREVLGALNDGRVDVLVVPFGLESEGARCTECGRLAQGGGRCRTCGGGLEALPDVVEASVGAALRQGARVETVSFVARDRLDGADIGAFLRF
jgi:peptide chain release factor subunit 1